MAAWSRVAVDLAAVPATPEHGAVSAPGWWRCRAVAPDGRPMWVALVRSRRYADEETVVLPEPEAVAAVGDDAASVAVLDGSQRVTRLEYRPRDGATVPPLWFVEVPERDAVPAAASLVAFTGHGVAAGALVTGTELAAAGVTSGDQVGALRWYPGSGEVDQVYVQPAWRRQRVASTLVAVSATLHEARGLARFWGDGRRTEMGEALRNSSAWSHRAADRTHVAPPMTPGSGT